MEEPNEIASSSRRRFDLGRRWRAVAQRPSSSSSRPILATRSVAELLTFSASNPDAPRPQVAKFAPRQQRPIYGRSRLWRTHGDLRRVSWTLPLAKHYQNSQLDAFWHSRGYRMFEFCGSALRRHCKWQRNVSRLYLPRSRQRAGILHPEPF